VLWLRRKDEETIEAFLRGVERDIPNVGADKLLANYFKPEALSGDRIAGSIPDRSPTGAKPKVDPDIGGVRLDGNLWIDVWRVLEKCSVLELQRLCLFYLDTHPGDLTDWDSGSETARTNLVLWLRRKDEETIEAFLRGVERDIPNVGAGKLLANYFKPEALSGDRIAGSIPDRSPTEAKPKVDPDRGGVRLDGNFWIDVWRVLEKCSVLELQRLCLFYLDTHPGDLTDWESGSETARTNLVLWLRRKDEETIEAFLRGVEDVRPSVGARELLMTYFELGAANAAALAAQEHRPEPGPDLWEDDYLPCGQAFADRDLIRTAVGDLQALSSLGILRVIGPKQVGKSRCHHYIRARLSRSADEVRLAYVPFDKQTPYPVYGGPSHRLVDQVLRDWRLEPLDIPSEEANDYPLSKVLGQLEERIRSKPTISQFWIVFDQFPKDHVAGPVHGNDTDAFIFYIADKASYHELNLRLVLLGYKKPYLSRGSQEMLVGLDYLTSDELRTFFRIVAENLDCPIPAQVDEFLSDYETGNPGNAHCRKLLQSIPGIINKMRNTRRDR
jgi:hypothetical protein